MDKITLSHQFKETKNICRKILIQGVISKEAYFQSELANFFACFPQFNPHYYANVFILLELALMSNF